VTERGKRELRRGHHQADGLSGLRRGYGPHFGRRPCRALSGGSPDGRGAAAAVTLRYR
jgi:hypothetical protein